MHSGQSGCVLVAVVSDKFFEALNLVDEEGFRQFPLRNSKRVCCDREEGLECLVDELETWDDEGFDLLLFVGWAVGPRF